jgi:hypothetical protein
MPLHPAYVVSSTKSKLGYNDFALPELVRAVAADPVFASEWKEALAIATAATARLDALQRVQLAPRSSAKLVAVDGMDITSIGDIATGEGPYFEEDMLRLPMLGTVAALFADQLRVLDLKDKQTISQFSEGTKLCKQDVLWAARKAAPESTGPAALQALVVGRCARVEGREGSWNARVLELMVYDASGRLVLVVGQGHVEGYRWSVEAGRPMLAGGRSWLSMQDVVLEAKKREAVAKQ